MKKMIIFGMVMFLFGCVSKSVKDDASFAIDEGILIVRLTSNWDSEAEDSIAPKLTFLINSGTFNKVIDLTGTDEYKILKMRAGDYRLNRITQGFRYLDIGEGSEFTIVPGKALYIGQIHMDIDVVWTSTYGRAEYYFDLDHARKSLSLSHPTISKEFELQERILDFKTY